MKKVTLKFCMTTAIAIFAIFNAKAQPFVSPGTAPDAQLSSGFDNIKFSPHTSASGIYNAILGNSTGTGLTINSNTGWGDGSSIIMNGENNGSSSDGAITVVSNSGVSGTGGAIGFWRYNQSTTNWENRMLITESGSIIVGNVTIPTGNPYKMYVEQGILTEKVKVAVAGSTHWSDFVFDDNYSLRPLDEVENFISENKHLPEIPSADEVVENGIDVATMDAKLLQKIEELTLYVIQQQKEINMLKSKLNK
jgi:hypothetical protein